MPRKLEKIFSSANELHKFIKWHGLVYWGYDWLRILCVISPAVVFFWRGCVELFLLADKMFLFIVMIALGCFVQIIFTFARDQCTEFGPLHVLAVYTFALSAAAHWSGIWALLDLWVGFSVYLNFAVLGVVLILLGSMRVINNITGAPFVLEMDLPMTTFNFPTMFKTAGINKGTSETCLYILDCFFSVVVIGSLVVFVWRGAWTLLDVLFYPEDLYVSAVGSLIIGYAFILMTFTLQAPMKRLCEWLVGFWRILAVDLYILFSFVGTINLWRGIWMLLDEYFIPSDFILSCWITHVVSFLFLVLINCSNSLLVRGVYIDGEEPGGKCVDFPTYYLRMFFQEQRKKKLMKQSQRIRISTLANKADDFEKGEKVAVYREDTGKSHVTVDLPHVTKF